MRYDGCGDRLIKKGFRLVGRAPRSSGAWQANRSKLIPAVDGAKFRAKTDERKCVSAWARLG